MKVAFRRVREKDLKRLNDIVNDEETARFLHLIPPVSLKKTREAYEEFKRKRHHWYVVVVDGDIAGSFTLNPNPKNTKCAHVGRFGICIAREYWGLGVGDRIIRYALREARKLNLKRVELTVVKGHRRAIRLYRRHGFKKEGVKKDAFKIKGRYHDMMVMARWLG
ncbi:MAG: GNAT family N-acetyltransferase [Candidatus Altiarchaeales archaeon]|nr:GNAT family N-acetyltransferase [Candidatus Altiarchaeales archaeon]MBD3417354.1 GNAT family N-acetyltransferase [Candidatus Altiarchaeales archaeon]